MNLLENNLDFLQLSDVESMEIYGGKDKPSGVVQWIGYYAHAAWDAFLEFEVLK